jgi:hypothetical protein
MNAGPADAGATTPKNNDTRVDFTVQVPAGIGLLAHRERGSLTPRAFRATPTDRNQQVQVDISTTSSARDDGERIDHASMDRAVWPNGAKFPHDSQWRGDGDFRLYLNARRAAIDRDRWHQSDFPLNIATDPGPKHAEGVLGGGGQKLDVTTVNGSISLLRR